MQHPYEKSAPAARWLMRQLFGFGGAYAFSWLIGTGFGADPIEYLISRLSSASPKTAQAIARKVFGGAVALNSKVAQLLEHVKDDWSTLDRLVFLVQIAKTSGLTALDAETLDVRIAKKPSSSIELVDSKITVDQLAEKANCSEKEAEAWINYFTGRQPLLYKIGEGMVNSNVLGIFFAALVSYYLPVEGLSFLAQNLSRGAAGYATSHLTEMALGKGLSFFSCYQKSPELQPLFHRRGVIFGSVNEMPGPSRGASIEEGPPPLVPQQEEASQVPGEQQVEPVEPQQQQTSTEELLAEEQQWEIEQLAQTTLTT